MSYSITVEEKLITADRTIAKTQTLTASSRTGLSESVPDSSTDLQINVAIDFSAMTLFYLVSDQDVTVETNSGDAADDTITLTAGVPVIWHTDSAHDCPLTADVTAIFVTNASGAAAQVDLEVLQDSTPA
jgi:hypothetical protein